MFIFFSFNKLRMHLIEYVCQAFDVYSYHSVISTY